MIKTLASRPIIVAGLALILIAAPGCRSRKKVTPKTTPTSTQAPTTDTVADVPMQPPVQDPNEDFVRNDPEVTREDLPADLDELNRTVHQRSWVRDAFFEYDASTLSADAQDALAVSASWLKSHPQYNLMVEGHCDERGTEQYNLALGDRRANVVKDYLTTLGLDASRIRVVSYGEEKPFSRGSNDVSWRQNRRAHLVLIGQ